jgi:hypothetical protein
MRNKIFGTLTKSYKTSTYLSPRRSIVEPKCLQNASSSLLFFPKTKDIPIFFPPKNGPVAVVWHILFFPQN